MKAKYIWILLILSLMVWTLWQNLTIGLSHYTIQSKRLPSSFDGYKIIQISDFHGAKFLGQNQGLLDLVVRQNPDMIAITGDLVDSRRQETASALALVRQLVHIAPTYYVTGNHEASMPQLYENLERQLVATGVQVLRNEQIELAKSDQTQMIVSRDLGNSLFPIRINNQPELVLITLKS